MLDILPPGQCWLRPVQQERAERGQPRGRASGLQPPRGAAGPPHSGAGCRADQDLHERGLALAHTGGRLQQRPEWVGHVLGAQRQHLRPGRAQPPRRHHMARRDELRWLLDASVGPGPGRLHRPPHQPQRHGPRHPQPDPQSRRRPCVLEPQMRLAIGKASPPRPQQTR
ncbi:hypothetical protein SANT12839_073670 [Streptomyces antimycoticus]|uniref:Uncharacterized protein n=1 Tax=Streptomyces antimycoticus TaxID=68175 RepID=A0A4D4KBZ4_9ACTN|nr:hypothetical protein SANT12839_073670 [Streptomyces antimycoticus]